MYIIFYCFLVLLIYLALLLHDSNFPCSKIPPQVLDNSIKEILRYATEEKKRNFLETVELQVCRFTFLRFRDFFNLRLLDWIEEHRSIQGQAFRWILQIT